MGLAYLVRLAPLALAALPAAAVSQAAAGQAADAASPPRAGQYRTALELVLFEAPGVPEDLLASARDAFVEGLGSGNGFCLAPEPAGAAMRRTMLEHIAEGDCRFSRFASDGAAVSAAMACTRETAIGGQVTVDGRIWAENADVSMTLQDFPGLGEARIVVRAQSVRVGDC